VRRVPVMVAWNGISPSSGNYAAPLKRCAGNLVKYCDKIQHDLCAFLMYV